MNPLSKNGAAETGTVSGWDVLRGDGVSGQYVGTKGYPVREIVRRARTLPICIGTYAALLFMLPTNQAAGCTDLRCLTAVPIQ